VTEAVVAVDGEPTDVQDGDHIAAVAVAATIVVDADGDKYDGDNKTIDDLEQDELPVTDGEDGTLVTVEDAVGDVVSTGVTVTLPVNDCAADGDTDALMCSVSAEVLETEDDNETVDERDELPVTDGEDGTLVTVEDAVGDVVSTGVTDTLPVNDCAADGDTDALMCSVSAEVLETEDDNETVESYQ
jgi:hypothetical protein